MTEIQRTIAQYMRGKSTPTVCDTMAFVGMIETGEATFEDFEAVGGVVLAAGVAKSKQHMDESREH